MAETLNARVSKLERSHLQTQKAIRSLVAAQKKTDQATKRTDHTLAALLAAQHKREERLDERIGKLVSAIGELIRRNGTK